MKTICSLGSLCILIAACAKPAEPLQKKFSFEEQLGLVSRDCLAIHNASLKPGDEVTLVSQPDVRAVGRETPDIREGTIVESLPKSCEDKVGNGDRETTPFFYRLREDETRNGLFIAVADSATPVALRNGNIDADLDGDGMTESFRTCASSEGVHFQVWTGEPLDGRPRWHWYFYAGYDTEPTCTEREYFGPK